MFRYKYSILSERIKSSIFIKFHRCIMKSNWEKILTSSEQKEIELQWKEQVLNYIDLISVDTLRNNQKKYVLSMFPYPSGNLHMGHVRVYTISDTLARFYHMKGWKVIHPMGWDAFGLPAENAAIERGENPARWTKSNIKRMKKQLKDLGCGFEWWRELATCDPEYYKWTQYIFLKLYQAGLAYKQKALVNWDPVDQTVLANEQVDENGCSWRSGAKVEKKLLSQWFIKSTRLSKELYDDLSEPSLENWRDIPSLQKHWIGDCSGYIIEMELVNSEGGRISDFDHLPVWMLEPEYLNDIAFLAIKSNNLLSSDTYKDKLNSSVLNIKAIDPITKRSIPIVVNDNVTCDHGEEIYVGIPCLKDEDKKLCNNLELSIPKIENSDVNVPRREDILNQLKKLNKGGHFGSPKLKDWLISRQRYWGTPIPIILCSNCGIMPVQEKHLPVKLPNMENISIKKGAQVLKEAKEWLQCECPRCKKPAQRETDTMDTFVDSSWYFLRFLDPQNEDELIGKDQERKLMPVDLYIGGKEHAILHLYYARFMHKFLRKLGLLSHKEPFKQLLVQGMVKSKAYQVKDTGKYLKPSDVNFSVSPPVEKETNSSLLIQYEKMSKSKHNGIDPQALVNEYGIDGVRLAILSNVGPQTERFWNPEDMNLTYKIMSKLWSVTRQFVITRKENSSNIEMVQETEFIEHETSLFENRNQLLLRANNYIESNKQFHSVVRAMQQLMGAILKVPRSLILSDEYEKSLRFVLLILHPMCPHLSAELWHRIKEVSTHKDYAESISIFGERWPSIDPNYEMELDCKVNEEDIWTIRIPQTEFLTLTQERAVELAYENDLLSSLLNGSPILKFEFKYYQNYKAYISFMTKSKQEIKKSKKKSK